MAKCVLMKRPDILWSLGNHITTSGALSRVSGEKQGFPFLILKQISSLLDLQSALTIMKFPHEVGKIDKYTVLLAIKLAINETLLDILPWNFASSICASWCGLLDWSSLAHPLGYLMINNRPVRSVQAFSLIAAEWLATICSGIIKMDSGFALVYQKL